MIIINVFANNFFKTTVIFPVVSGLGCMMALDLVIIVPEDVLTPNGARPSAGTEVIAKLESLLSRPSGFEWFHGMTSGLILGLRPANERRRYFVTTSLIGRSQA